MGDHAHHEHLVKELAEMLEPVFEHSPQAVYLYLDDAHKACSKRFADLIGYDSPEEWAENQYPLDDVDKEDQESVVAAYMDASRKMKASKLKVKVVKKDGTTIPVEVTFVPLSYRNEVFVLHFIEKV